jgi:hypothetical protein
VPYSSTNMRQQLLYSYRAKPNILLLCASVFMFLEMKGRSCTNVGYWTVHFHKERSISWVGARLSAFQKGIYSMGLVGWMVGWFVGWSVGRSFSRQEGYSKLNRTIIAHDEW